MATPVPTSFEPLASSNPVPADTDAMTALGQQYTATAQQILDQANTLQQLSTNSTDSWKSQAGTVFTSKASSLATRILQAEQRYTTAGAALTAAAEPMYEAQQVAYAAVEQAQDAQSTMTANAPAPKAAAGSPPPTADQQAATAAAASKYSAASDSLSAAQASFKSAVEAYHAAASAAANAINHELGKDPLKDSWLQAHFEWLEKFFHILGIIIMALAALALLICLPGVGGILDGIGLGLLGSVIGWTAAVAGAVTTGFDGAEAAQGLKSWKSFGMDIVGDATFGIGKVADPIADAIADAAKTAGKSAASDAAEDALKNAGNDDAGNGIKNAADDAASSAASSAASKEFTDLRNAQNEWVKENPVAAGPNAFVFTPESIAAGAKAAGEDAALDVLNDTSAVSKAYGDAAESIVDAKLYGATTMSKWGALNSLTTQSSGIANNLAELNILAGAVPDAAKIGASLAGLRTIGITTAIFQMGSFGIAGYSLSPAAG